MTLPATPLPDDAVDKAARAVALEVADHIETMYPAAAQAVAWQSCKRSIAGVIRRAMAEIGESAEQGRMDAVIREQSRRRANQRKMRRKIDEVMK